MATGVTEAGEAHLAELQERRAQVVADLLEDRLADDLANLTVGDIVFERTADGADHYPRGGAVVRIRRDEDTGMADQYTVLDIRPPPGGRGRWTFKIWHFAPADIGEVQPNTPLGRHGKTKAVFHCLGDHGGNHWDSTDTMLLGWAINLKNGVEQ
jgi:hypothetical protein